jgi:hypothetical protein
VPGRSGELGISLVLWTMIEDKVPDHSAFSRARHERFRESDMFRRLFRARC